jgi:hypothetical protein
LDDNPIPFFFKSQWICLLKMGVCQILQINLTNYIDEN